MGKRSTGTFERNERDYYRTPRTAVWPLLPFLGTCIRFAEPCAGDGRLVSTLTEAGHGCGYAADVEPQVPGIKRADALNYSAEGLRAGDLIITNPPWRRDILHPLIEHLSSLAPTWLLFDADWMHTVQAGPYLSLCRKIVSVGRVKWIEGSKFTGKDNCAWYLFDYRRMAGPPSFFGRTERLVSSPDWP